MVVHHRISESVTAVVKDYNALIGRSWVRTLSSQLLTSKYFDNLQCYIEQIYLNTDMVYPKNPQDIFKMLKTTQAEDIKVVIFGDEPAPSHYSNGLAFGAYRTSLNIPANTLKCTKAIKNCLYPDIPNAEFDPSLVDWATQGVLLLNTSLISEYGNKMQHEYVFRHFIRTIIKEVSNLNCGVVFVFTSKDQSDKFEKYIDTNFHTILHYDGIDADSSMFDDINRVIETELGASETIQW